MRPGRTITAAGVALAAVLCAPVAAPAAVGDITTFEVEGGPRQLTAGPDGAVWFTGFSGDLVGRITTDGQARRSRIGRSTTPTASRSAPTARSGS